MPTEVLYRKWRPQRFADVSGQEVVTRTLVNAVASHKVSHAYLFSGPRGTGKTTTARILARAVNCERNAPGVPDSPGEPCGACASCTAFASGSALDLIELDAASNRGIDDIRDIRENANYMPMGGVAATKVYLIDEVHMLTEHAFNALLKTLEEPPAHVIFILATTDAHKIPATIVSRCQRHEFKRIPLSAMVGRLAHICEQEGMDVPREGLELIARAATGSLRDAINLLEQVCDSYDTSPSLEAVREGLGLIGDERALRLALQSVEGDLAGGLATIGSVRDDGADLRQFQKEVVMRLRELLHAKSRAASDGQYTDEQLAALRESVAAVPLASLVRALRAFGQADLRADPLSPIPLELALAEAALTPEPATVAPQAAAPAPRPATPAPRPATPAPRPPQPRTAPPRARQQPAPPAARERVPDDLRRDLNSASAEDIARMLGSKNPVIPPASDDPEPAATTVSGNGAAKKPAASAPESAGGDLDTLAKRLYDAAKQAEKDGRTQRAAFLNGSCHAVSWEDGVLTLGFYAPFHKGKVESNRQFFEEVATQVLGAPVSIRCIIAPKPAKPISKSPLVQHAVQNHGAQIVSEDQES